MALATRRTRVSGRTSREPSLTLLRASFRLVVLGCVLAAGYTWLRVSALVLGLVRGGGWAGPNTARWRSRTFHGICRIFVAVMRVRAEVQGRPPAAPFILVSNHLSYLDIVLFGSQVPAVFVSRADVRDWPIIGTMCRAVGTVFIDRGSKRAIPQVMERIREVLDQGQGVVIFPEGTTTGGAEVGPFKPSLLETAASAELPVSYAALSYRTPEGAAPAQESVCWWGDMTFGRHLIGMLGLPEIRATLRFGEERILERDRKVLAERLHFAVEAQFQPVN